MKTINSIEWHEDNLKNMKSNLVGLEKQALDMNERIKRLRENCHFLSEQITSAKISKKDSFDSRRYKRNLR